MTYLRPCFHNMHPASLAASAYNATRVATMVYQHALSVVTQTSCDSRPTHPCLHGKNMMHCPQGTQWNPPSQLATCPGWQLTESELAKSLAAWPIDAANGSPHTDCLAMYHLESSAIQTCQVCIQCMLKAARWQQATLDSMRHWECCINSYSKTRW